MKKILLFLIAILSPIIFISKVNAAIRYPLKIYPSGLGGQTIQHAVINDANWYGYNSSHSTKKWAWQFDFSDLDDTKTYDLSGTILNQVSLSENLSSAVVTFNDKACTLNYSFSNNEILWSDKDGNNTYGNDFNYFSIGHMTTFTCENVEIRKDSNNYFNIYFEKNTTASYMSPLYLGINAGSVMSGSQQETNDKLQDSINKQEEIKQEQEKTNEELGELNDNLTNSDAPEGMDSLDSASGWLPPGPVDSLLTLPLSMLNNISTSLGSTCKPINLPIPFVNKDLTMPCLNSIYSQISGLGVFLNSIGTIAAGFMLYYYFKKLYAYIDNLLSLKNNGEGWGDV